MAKIRLTPRNLKKLPQNTRFSIVYALYRCRGLWERYTVSYDIGLPQARYEIEITTKKGLRWFGVIKEGIRGDQESERLMKPGIYHVFKDESDPGFQFWELYNESGKKKGEFSKLAEAREFGVLHRGKHPDKFPPLPMPIIDLMVRPGFYRVYWFEVR